MSLQNTTHLTPPNNPLPDYMKSLNEDQIAASDDLFDFIMSKDKEYRVSGPAGTGKTYLVTSFLKRILLEYEKVCQLMGMVPAHYSIRLTTTTNKAAEVLSKATNSYVSTIHSHLSLRVQDDYDTGITKVIRTPNWHVISNEIIIIDEASMIDRKLYKEIHESTDDTCKIIYLGDHCQMAPVGERLSRVYTTEENTSYLNTPVRNAEQPALVDLCAALRNTVETGNFFDIRPVPGVIDIFSADECFAFLAQEFSSETDTARIIAYTNHTVQQYNNHVRSLRAYPAHFVAGESVICNTPFPVSKRVTVYAQAELKILDSDASSPEVIDICNRKIRVYPVKIALPDGSGTANIRLPFKFSEVRDALRAASRLKDWESYFWIKKTIPDLRPKDAITVYKAQGSTYDTVFLDLADISRCTIPDQLSRLVYVGVSRAKSRVVIFGELPDRVF